VKPELTYPSEDKLVYCHDCKEHISENDLFGRFKNYPNEIFCTACFLAHDCEKELRVYTRYTQEDLIK
jgi:hypothetical protein